MPQQPTRTSMPEHYKVLILIPIFLCLLIGAIFINATTSIVGGCFTEIDISNGPGNCHFLDGDYSVRIYTFEPTFDGAIATLQKVVEGTNECGSIVKIEDVGVSGLVGVTQETAFVALGASYGYYRLDVSGGMGSESLRMNVCRKAGN